ncbi:MAG: four helix bundle protein [Phycisphaera sp.]|nr:four helix bundle protein [Phycisphaera sp.]
MKRRTKAFALRVMHMVESLPKAMVTAELGRQLLRSGTSVAANYRAACRARSRAEFVAKLGIVEEEADESAFWIELLVEGGHVKQARAADLANEANELLAIVVATIRTARRNKK